MLLTGRTTKGALECHLVLQKESIVGVDEVGRGCLAGPVAAACVRLNYEALWSLSETDRKLIRDSKTVSHAQRLKAIVLIKSIALDAHVGSASVEEIEQHGILNATFFAMNRAIHKLTNAPSIILVDGNQKIRPQSIRQVPLVKGDSLAFCIAAASIVAKEYRDDFMKQQATVFPSYGFESNVGYGTSKHLTAIENVGICSLHRKTFAPVRNFI